MDKFKEDWNGLQLLGFWKLVSLTIFQSSFFLHVAFDIMLGKKIVWHEAVIFSFASNFFADGKFHWE